MGNWCSLKGVQTKSSFAIINVSECDGNLKISLIAIRYMASCNLQKSF